MTHHHQYFPNFKPEKNNNQHSTKFKNMVPERKKQEVTKYAINTSYKDYNDIICML